MEARDEMRIRGVERNAKEGRCHGSCLRRGGLGIFLSSHRGRLVQNSGVLKRTEVEEAEATIGSNRGKDVGGTR